MELAVQIAIHFKDTNIQKSFTKKRYKIQRSQYHGVSELSLIFVEIKRMFKGIELLRTKQIAKKFRFLPYILVGISVFTFNSNPDTHPYLQIYVTLLEVKLGIVLVYLLSKKLGKISKEKHSI